MSVLKSFWTGPTVFYSYLIFWGREGNGNLLQYFAWKIPWTEEPGGLQSMGSLRVDTTEQLHFHALEKEMATHSSVLAWRIPGTGEPGGLPSMGSHRVRHDWRDLAAAAAYLGEYFLAWFFWLKFALKCFLALLKGRICPYSAKDTKAVCLDNFREWNKELRLQLENEIPEEHSTISSNLAYAILL